MLDVDAALDEASRRLSEEFGVGMAEVRSRMRRARERWRGARIHDFVALLAEKRVRDELRACRGVIAVPWSNPHGGRVTPEGRSRG
jgi:hypothetical protein